MPTRRDSPDQLRAQALAASEEANRMLQEAFDLLIQGRVEEARAKQRAADEKHREAGRPTEQANQTKRW